MRIYQTLRKRGLALFLALIMCLSLVQVPAFAAEDDASEPADALVMDVTGPGVQEPEAVPEEESPAPESEEIAAPDTQEEPEADEPEEYAPEYAAVEELEAAFEAVGEILEDGDVEGGIAALEEYLRIFDRLSPEDQEANQEAREAAVDYLQTLKDSLEGIEDEDVEALALNTGHYKEYRLGIIYVDANDCQVDYQWPSSREFRCSYAVSHEENVYSNHKILLSDMKDAGPSNSLGWAKMTPGLNGKKISYNKWPAWINGKDTALNDGDAVCLIVRQAHTHSYTVQGNWVTAPNCVTDGTATFTCSCGQGGSQTKTVAGSKLGHAWSSVWVDSNSSNSHTDGCTSTDHRQVCTRCNGTLTGGTRTEAHTYGAWEPVTPAQPGVDGQEKRTCTASGCGHYETQPIPALPESNDPGTRAGSFTVTKSFVDLDDGVIRPDVSLTYEAWRTKDNEMVGQKESGTVALSKNADGTYSGNITPTVWDIQTNGDGALPEAERLRYKNVVVITEDTDSAKVDGYTWNSFTALRPADGKNDGPDTVNFTMDGATFGKLLSVKNTYTKDTQPELPNLTITKSADKDIVKVGETVKYTITVANTGKAAATNVVVSDTLPKGLEWVQDNDASYKGGVLTWNIPRIEAGGSKSVSFTARVTQSGAISNTASVTSDEIKTPVNSAPEDITGVKVSIKTTKSHSKITVDEKTGIATIPYTVTVKNTGDDLFGLDIIDKLSVKVTDQNGNPSTEPVKVTYKDLKVDGQTVSAEMSETGGIVNAIARNGKFAAEQTVTLTYNIEVQNKGQTAVVATLSNTATGGSWSTNPSGGRMFRMARDGEYDVTDSASDTASVGDSASVVIPPPQAETVTITVKFVDENGNEVGKTETTVEKNGSYDVTEETRKVPNGYEANGNPTGDVKGTADTDKVVTVPVKKTPAPPAPTPADWGRLTLTKTANKTQARAGEDITYTIRVTNNTGKNLTGIRVSEPLDTNVTFKSAAPAGYDAASGVWTIASLANGASATLTLTVTVKDGVTNATIRNTAAITDASTTGPDPEKLPDGTRPGDTANVTVPEADARRVTVTWLNWNGDRLDRADWNTDEREPSYSGRRPTRPDSSRYTYTFAGWGNREVDEDGNVTYTALFDRERIDDDDDDDDRPTGGGNTGGGSTGGSTGGGTTTIPDTQTPLDPGTTIIDQEVPLAGAVGLNDADHFAYVIGYEDGTVRPLNNISRAEVATIFFRLMTDDYRQANWSTVNSFTDVKEGDWYNNAVSTCAKAGALKGRGDGSVFDPNANITRAEFAVIAARFLDSSYVDDGKGDFADTADHWAAKEIRLAAKAGWVNGNGNTFNPDAYITRAEVMTIVNRMLDRTPDKDHMLPDMKKWTDNPEDAWYYEAVQEATNEHDYTRDETAVESWTLVKEHRDWAALELGWAANGPAAPQGETETQGLPDGI